jgi:hypothetical protein
LPTSRSERGAVARHSAETMRKLGVAVIAAAIYDAAGLIEMKAERGRYMVRGTWMTAAELQEDAYLWLTTESERLDFWAECAGLDMQTVIDGADAAIAYAKRTPRGQSIWGDVRRVRGK